ncbi:MAG: prepilin-type N-terminal cleavage/methylation domain-containing protein [Planctomycetota bacterium]
MRRSEHRGDGGFTLLEVLVVLAILSIIAGSLTPMVTRQVERARERRVTEDLAAIASALEDYFFENARFPADLSDATFVSAFASGSLRDPWGQAYTYEKNKTGLSVTIGTFGSPAVRRKDPVQERVVTSSRVGRIRTRQRLETIQVALNRFLQGGGVLSGDWTGADRAALGLGGELDDDGWGRPFRSDALTSSVTSQGFDGKSGTADDMGF